MVHCERRPYRQSRVPCSWLNVNAFKWRPVEYLSIRKAIERNAPRQAQRFLPGFFCQGAPVRRENFFQRSLHASGYIPVPLIERFSFFTRGPQPLFQISRKEPAKYWCPICFSPTHVRALALMREIFQAQVERQRPVGMDDEQKLLQKFRLAVSRQAHHFVFVAEFPEADVLGQRGVIHSQRMREPNFAEWMHFRPFAKRPHATCEISQTVGGKHG